MKSANLIILLLTLLLSCSDRREGNKNLGPDLALSMFDSIIDLGITSPVDFGGMISASYVFQDSLIYILSSKSAEKIYRVNLDTRQFLDPIALDPNFFSKPSGIYVHNEDSIFVSEFGYPIIYLINQNGDVLNTYDLYRENLWKMPKEGFSNFGLFSSYGIEFEYNADRNSFFIPLKQLDLWYFVEEKKSFPVLGEYSLESADFINLFGTYPGIYGDSENYLLPFFLSHPTVTIAGDKVIVSYSLDPNLYVYDLDGNFLETFLATIKNFQLSEPLRYNIPDFDDQGMFEYSGRSSFFTDFFYVKESNKYVRIFNKCIPNAEGFCKSRSIFALIFDKNLALVEARLIGNDYEPRYFPQHVSFRKGFLSKLNQPSNDDIFLLNDYFTLD